MADSSTHSESAGISPEQRESDLTTNGTGSTAEAPPSRRKVYESTLIPERKRLRVSKWVTIPAILAVIGLVGYYYVVGSHNRRAVNTAGKVAYAVSARPTGGARIWISKLDGTEKTALTSAGKDDESPVFSPDGNQIAFISTRTGGVRQVYVMDGDGKNVAQVTRNAGAKALPSFAPSNNQLIGYTAGGILYSEEIGVGGAERLLPTPPRQGSSGLNTDTQDSQFPTTIPEFAWAPSTDLDKQGLAAVEESNGVQSLALVPSLDKDPVTTTDGKENGPKLASANAMSLAWSPDGGLLAVATLGVKVPDGRSVSGILLFDGSGNPTQTPPVVQLPSTTAGPEHLAFSPDGTQIVFELWKQADLTRRQCVGLFTVPTAGHADPRQILAGDAEKMRFARDGSILFLHKRADGGRDLCRIHLDASGFQRISDGREDVIDFAISPQVAH